MKTRKNRVKKIAEGSAGEIYINSKRPDEIIKKAHNLSAEKSGLWLDGPISTYEMMKREAKVHKTISDAVKDDPELSSHLPKFISYDPEKHILVMERKEGKNLEVLCDTGYAFSELEIKEIILQIATTLGKLQKIFPGFVHGDFNPANVLISFDPIHVTLIDFSFVGSNKQNEFPNIKETKGLESCYDLIRIICYTIQFMKSKKQDDAKRWLAKFVSRLTKKSFLTSQKDYEQKWFDGKACTFEHNTKKIKQSSKIKNYKDAIELIKSL